jgi:hypothetical protein
MNNTTIRTLAAIVVVVVVIVLIFTAGSLVATTISTPPAVFAYQNKGVRDNGNSNTVIAQITKQNEKVSGYNNTQEQEAQNMICNHSGNNATCSQERIISTTQIPLSTPSPTQQPSATLTIIKHIINDNGGTSSAKDFTISVSGTNVSLQSLFSDAESPGTTVTLKPGIFSVVLLQQANATTTATAVADYNKCSGDIITCTQKETHHSTKDTIPFILPIPFP